MVDILMIKADDPKVLSQYHKQKLEFHFQQKSDNDFVRFLLDTAVRVISIVQHLAPVLEAVSTAGTDQIVSNQSDYNINSTMKMEIEQSKPTKSLVQSNISEETSNLDVESLTNTTPSPAFNVNSLGSALKSFAPPTSAFQTALSSATSVQALNSSSITPTPPPHNPLNASLNSASLNSASLNSASLNSASASSSPILQHVPAFSSPAPKVDALQLETASSLLEFDKTIAALQNELDSVSQTLVSESEKAATPPPPPPPAFNPSNLANLAIIKRLQENLNKESSEITPQSGKELDLIKTIQETIANRAAKTEDMIKVKEEMEVIPTLSMFRDTESSRQANDRIQQLMSSLNNSTMTSLNNSTSQPPAISAAAPVFTPPNTTALSQISSLAPCTTSTLNQLATGVSPGPSLSPGLKNQGKKNGNPLSMLHLQGNGVDQAAILSVLYNDRNTSQASPDLKMKSAARSSPNRLLKGLLGDPTLLKVEHDQHVSCHVCGKVFRGSSRAQNLKRHFNNVHLKLKPFRCVVCGMMFGLKYNLKSHMSRAHNIPPVVMSNGAMLPGLNGAHKSAFANGNKSSAFGNTNGNKVSAFGSTNGNGLSAFGGTNGNGLSAFGNSNGNGVSAFGSSTGNGVNGFGSSNGNGILHSAGITVPQSILQSSGISSANGEN